MIALGTQYLIESGLENTLREHPDKIRHLSKNACELRTAFSVMLKRTKNLRLAGEPELIIHSFARGLSKLPVKFDRV